MVATVWLTASNVFAYDVWLGTSFSPTDSAAKLNQWSNTAVQVTGIDGNCGPVTIFSGLAIAQTNMFAEIPRSRFQFTDSNNTNFPNRFYRAVFKRDKLSGDPVGSNIFSFNS